MTKTIDALKLAEEALEGWKEYDTWTDQQMWNDDDEEALAAIREARAEQELYEPEGRCKECLAYNGHLDYCSKSAKREWVDLTDDEIGAVMDFGYATDSELENANAVITAFKEKNK